MPTWTAPSLGGADLTNADLHGADSGLKRRNHPFRFGKPKPQVSQASMFIALETGHLSPHHDPRSKLGHQLHSPHQLHQTHPSP